MKNSEIVTASEIAEYVFCPEAWRLARLGHASSNQTEREAGTVHHARKATAEVVAGSSIALGRWLILAALLALATLWWLSR